MDRQSVHHESLGNVDQNHKKTSFLPSRTAANKTKIQIWPCWQSQSPGHSCWSIKCVSVTENSVEGLQKVRHNPTLWHTPATPALPRQEDFQFEKPVLTNKQGKVWWWILKRLAFGKCWQERTRSSRPSSATWFRDSLGYVRYRLQRKMSKTTEIRLQ